MEGKQVMSVLNLDVILHPSDDEESVPPFNIQFWVNAYSEDLGRSTKRVLEQYAPLRAQIVRTETKASDEASFWEIGVKGLLIYTTAPGWGMVKHTITDNLSQPGTDPQCGLAVARGVAIAALTQARCFSAH